MPESKQETQIHIIERAARILTSHASCAAAPALLLSSGASTFANDPFNLITNTVYAGGAAVIVSTFIKPALFSRSLAFAAGAFAAAAGQTAMQAATTNNLSDLNVAAGVALGATASFCMQSVASVTHGQGADTRLKDYKYNKDNIRKTGRTRVGIQAGVLLSAYVGAVTIGQILGASAPSPLKQAAATVPADTVQTPALKI
ncbi:MAG: hypothetical protein V4621_04630 [Pseudomonadota bacterium]